MRRRSPPSSLHLLPPTAPLPPRGQPKHAMPSMPRPTFQPPSMLPRPATRASPSRATHAILPPLDIPLPLAWDTFSPSAPAPVTSPRERRPQRILKGPWDHSASIKVELDIAAVLTMPKPVAVSAGGR